MNDEWLTTDRSVRLSLFAGRKGLLELVEGPLQETVPDAIRPASGKPKPAKAPRKPREVARSVQPDAAPVEQVAADVPPAFVEAETPMAFRRRG